MKPYPLVALNHFTAPGATTRCTVHTTAQTSYGRALPPDTAQNTKTREPESDCSRDLRTTRRSNRLRYFVGALMALLSPKLRRKFYVPEERQSFHIP